MDNLYDKIKYIGNSSLNSNIPSGTYMASIDPYTGQFIANEVSQFLGQMRQQSDNEMYNNMMNIMKQNSSFNGTDKINRNIFNLTVVPLDQEKLNTKKDYSQYDDLILK